jgi:hypothetical protein
MIFQRCCAAAAHSHRTTLSHHHHHHQQQQQQHHRQPPSEHDQVGRCAHERAYEPECVCLSGVQSVSSACVSALVPAAARCAHRQWPRTHATTTNTGRGSRSRCTWSTCAAARARPPRVCQASDNALGDDNALLCFSGGARHWRRREGVQQARRSATMVHVYRTRAPVPDCAELQGRHTHPRPLSCSATERCPS